MKFADIARADQIGPSVFTLGNWRAFLDAEQCPFSGGMADSLLPIAMFAIGTKQTFQCYRSMSLSSDIMRCPLLAQSGHGVVGSPA